MSGIVDRRAPIADGDVAQRGVHIKVGREPRPERRHVGIGRRGRVTARGPQAGEHGFGVAAADPPVHLAAVCPVVSLARRPAGLRRNRSAVPYIIGPLAARRVHAGRADARSGLERHHAGRLVKLPRGLDRRAGKPERLGLREFLEMPLVHFRHFEPLAHAAIVDVDVDIPGLERRQPGRLVQPRADQMVIPFVLEKNPLRAVEPRIPRELDFQGNADRVAVVPAAVMAHAHVDHPAVPHEHRRLRGVP